MATTHIIKMSSFRLLAPLEMKNTPSKSYRDGIRRRIDGKRQKINYIKEALLKFSRKKRSNCRYLFSKFNNEIIFQAIFAAKKREFAIDNLNTAGFQGYSPKLLPGKECMILFLKISFIQILQ